MLDRIDDAIARVERLLLLLSLGMMTVLVGLDVAQRTFSRPVGRTANLLADLLQATVGLSPGSRATIEGAVGEGVFLLLAAVAFVLATHAGRRAQAEKDGQPPPAFAGSAAKGLATLVAVVVFVRLLLWAFPSSVPGAQKFALGFMLWAGLLGASLATRARRHIMLDAIVKKLEDERDRRLFGLLSGVAAALFCAVLFVLAALQIQGEIHEWWVGDGVGVFPALPLPLWLITLAIPVGFLIMTFRFLKNACHDWLHGPPSGADAHGVDLEELAQHDPLASDDGAAVAQGGAA